MSEDVYRKLAKVLDTLPNGFPATKSGVEIRLLNKIFTTEEADLFCDLRLSFENPQQIAERTGRPLAGLEERLVSVPWGMCRYRERERIAKITSGVRPSPYSRKRSHFTCHTPHGSVIWDCPSHGTPDRGALWSRPIWNSTLKAS